MKSSYLIPAPWDPWDIPTPTPRDCFSPGRRLGATNGSTGTPGGTPSGPRGDSSEKLQSHAPGTVIGQFFREISCGYELSWGYFIISWRCERSLQLFFAFSFFFVLLQVFGMFFGHCWPVDVKICWHNGCCVLPYPRSSPLWDSIPQWSADDF